MTAGFGLVITSSNYARIRKALTTMANQSWYRGIVRDTAQEALQDWTTYAKSITHKLTGQLASSLTWEYKSHESAGRVYINPRAVYLRGRNSIQWPKIYGPIEHERGGSHAFFARTLEARGPRVVEMGFKALVRGIPKV